LAIVGRVLWWVLARTMHLLDQDVDHDQLDEYVRTTAEEMDL
jgi:hypothetical protein